MEKPDTGASSHSHTQTLIEASIGLVMLLLAFFAIAGSDVSAKSTQWYWSALVLLFAVVAFVSDRLHTEHDIADIKSGLTIALHWLGVFLAIELVHYFVSSGRIANADIGLTNALILALGCFLFGIHGSWRFIVIGAGLAAATWAVALVEEYLWVLFCVAIVAVACMVLGVRLIGRFRAGTDES